MTAVVGVDSVGDTLRLCRLVVLCVLWCLASVSANTCLASAVSTKTCLASVASTKICLAAPDALHHPLYHHTEPPVYSLHPTEQSTWWSTLPLHLVPDPFTVTLHAGEALYLPSLWFHGVRHGGPCDECGAGDAVAVNYWFDMQYDARFCYFKAMERSLQGET